MRRQGAGYVLAVCLTALAVSVASRAQDGADRTGKLHYWPHRVFSIPLDVATLEKSFADKGQATPTHLQLYSALARGKWQSAGPKKPLAGLDVLSDGKKGFSFTADRDGEYEFSVQYHFKDGSAAPQNLDELSPMLRVTIDTTLPNVRVNVVGNGVEWSATDDNLDPDGVRLQAKYPSWPEWRTVERAQPFRPQDGYAWKLQPNQELDVRVLARDRAGNENYSVPVRVPGTGAFNTGFPRPGGDAPIPGGGGAGGLPQPRVDYVKTPVFDIDYKIERAGRSGIQAAELYVQKQQRGGWEKAQRYPLKSTATTGDTLKLIYTAKADDEGLYGFYVAPESGAGVKADPPSPNSPPMVYVVYDKTAPFLKLTGVRVGAGGANGPQVEFMWETFDQNLLADPISIEYSIDKNAAQWNMVRYRLPPGTRRDGADGLTRYVGQFVWDVPDEKLWKFYVRVRSVDRAGNTTTDVREEPVVVDLEKPAASITGVRGSGAPPPGSTDSPAPRPQPAPKGNTPAPRPPMPAPEPAAPMMPPVTNPSTGGPATPALPNLPMTPAAPPD
ncbi:hypothetical protein J0H58_25115 [bacterium]|nr:hypothetical protein [bacterium]